MSSELYIEPEWKGYNAVTGQFLKGHVPHNKGEKVERVNGYTQGVCERKTRQNHGEIQDYRHEHRYSEGAMIMRNILERNLYKR